MEDAVQDEVKWFVLDHPDGGPTPVDTLQVQTNVPIGELIAAGENYDQVVDKFLESMRQDVLNTWEKYGNSFRQVENPVVAQIKDAIAKHQAEGAK